MTRRFFRMDDYPAFGEYVASLESEVVATSDCTRIFLLALARTLRSSDADLVHQWCEAVSQFAATSSNFRKDYDIIESVLIQKELNLPDLISEIGELAIKQGTGPLFLASCQSLFEGTGRVVYTFLGAWAALNLNDYETCIAECERIVQPSAPVATLLGQAYLESGKLREAVDALETAVKINPREILAWFQLAKACHALGAGSRMWEAVCECERLAPRNVEVAYLSALAALLSRQRDHIQTAWQRMMAVVSTHQSQAELASALIDLTLESKDVDRTQQLIRSLDWSTLFSQTSIAKRVSKLLIFLQTSDRMDLAADLLKHLTDGSAQKNSATHQDLS